MLGTIASYLIIASTLFRIYGKKTVMKTTWLLFELGSVIFAYLSIKMRYFFDFYVTVFFMILGLRHIFPQFWVARKNSISDFLRKRFLHFLKGKEIHVASDAQDPKKTSEDFVPVKEMAWQKQIVLIGMTLIFSLGLSYLPQLVPFLFPNQQLSYLDALSSVVFFVGSFLSIHYYSSNFIWWIVFNLLHVFQHVYAGYYSLLQKDLIMCFISLYGYLRWKNNIRLTSLLTENKVQESL